MRNLLCFDLFWSGLFALEATGARIRSDFWSDLRQGYVVDCDSLRVHRSGAVLPPGRADGYDAAVEECRAKVLWTRLNWKSGLERSGRAGGEKPPAHWPAERVRRVIGCDWKVREPAAELRQGGQK